MKSSIIKKIKVLPSSDLEDLNDNSKTQNAPSSIGDKLRVQREKNGLTIQDIANALRISEPYLRAIENMERDSLPERVYSLGFVRSYALHVGMDPQSAVNQFKEEIYGNYQGEVLSLPEPVVEMSRANWKIIFICTVIVCAIVFSWYKLTRKSQMQEPEKPVVTSEDIKSEPEPEPTAVKVEPTQIAPIGLRNHVEHSQKVFIEYNLKPNKQEQHKPVSETSNDEDSDR
jgi:cytoskeletal protein RodZ